MTQHYKLLTIGMSALAVVLNACDEKTSPAKRMPREETMNPSVSCQLDLTKRDNRIIVELRFRNDGEESVPITWWKFIAEGKMTWSAFDVTHETVIRPYKCLTIKRGSPSEKDFYHLKPGETYTSTIDITPCYDFSVPGVYQVRYRSFKGGPNIVSNEADLTIE